MSRDMAFFTPLAGNQIPATHQEQAYENNRIGRDLHWDETATTEPSDLNRGQMWADSTDGRIYHMLKIGTDAFDSSVNVPQIIFSTSTPPTHLTDTPDGGGFQRIHDELFWFNKSLQTLNWYDLSASTWKPINTPITATCPLNLECATATESLNIFPDADASGGTPTIDGPYFSQRGHTWTGASSLYRGIRSYLDVITDADAGTDEIALIFESDPEGGTARELMRLQYMEGATFADLYFQDDTSIGIDGGGDLHFRTLGAGFTTSSFSGATNGKTVDVRVDGLATAGSKTISSGILRVTGASWDGAASVDRSFEFITRFASPADAADEWSIRLASSGPGQVALADFHSTRAFDYFGDEDVRWRWQIFSAATGGDKDKDSIRLELEAASWDGAVSRLRSMWWQTEIESPADADDDWAWVLYSRDHAGTSVEQARFSTGQHLVLPNAIARNEATYEAITLENIGAGNFQLSVRSDFDFSDIAGVVLEPQADAASGGSPILDSGGFYSTVRVWDGAASHDIRTGFASVTFADLDPGPASGVYQWTFYEPGSPPAEVGFGILWTSDESSFSVDLAGVEDELGINCRPAASATSGSPVQSPIFQVNAAEFGGSSSKFRGIALRAHVTSDEDVGSDEYEGFIGLNEQGLTGTEIGNFVDYIELHHGASLDAVLLSFADPLFGINSASDETITLANIGAGELAVATAGRIRAKRRVAASTSFAHGDDAVVLDSSAALRDYALPASASTPEGTTVTIKRDGVGFAVTITPAGADTIDGVGAALTLVVDRQARTLMLDGTDWQTVGTV